LIFSTSVYINKSSSCVDVISTLWSAGHCTCLIDQLFLHTEPQQLFQMPS
jgi:hypothetical protein